MSKTAKELEAFDEGFNKGKEYERIVNCTKAKRITVLETEAQENARIIGMSGERELALRANISILERQNAQLLAQHDDMVLIRERMYHRDCRYRAALSEAEKALVAFEEYKLSPPEPVIITWTLLCIKTSEALAVIRKAKS